jgi:uncharacterized protein (DUF302 family)
MSKYIVTTSKSFETVCQDLQQNVIANKFGVLHIHDLKASMNAKGVPFDKNVRIFEVCNPMKAKQVLEHNIEFNLGLPCRISVWESEEQVHIGMITPTAVLGMLSNDDSMTEMANEVQATMEKIIGDSI